MKRDFLENYLSNVLSFFEKRHTLNYYNTKEIKNDYKGFYNKKFNILWGYYEILRKKNDTIISQFYTKQIDHKTLKKFRTNVYNFNFIEITRDKNIEEDFIKIVETSLRSSPQDFNKRCNVPKAFQNLDYFNIDIERESDERGTIGRSGKHKGSEKACSDTKLSNTLTDFYKNTDIQKELDKHPFYVVLNEEVYFFLMLYEFVKCDQNDKKLHRKNIKTYLDQILNKDHQYGLRQLLKYTTSIIFCDSLTNDQNSKIIKQLWKNHFKLAEYHTENCEGKKKTEYEYRRFFNKTRKLAVKNIDEVPKIDTIVDLLNQLCHHFLRISREKVKKTFKTDFNNEWKNMQILNLITRFHIEPYQYLLRQGSVSVLPDFFVFPIFQNYKNTGLNQLKTKNLPLDIKENQYINLNRPVLFSCYVKPIFEIGKKTSQYKSEKGEALFDESPETIKGFHLTKVVAKELAAPLVQSEFFGPQILNLIRPQAIKSSLAAVMARNQSHNFGSHVLNRMSSSEVMKDFFDFYKKQKSCFLQDFPMESGIILSKDKNQKSSSSVIANKSSDKDLNESFVMATYEKSGNQYKPVYILTQRPQVDSLDPPEISRVFHNYLKQRMDFVADVATSDQFELSNKKHLISDLFRSFERNFILLHNISGKGEEFPFTFKFEFYKKNTEVPITDFDPIVSIPNDVLGDQAFYILLENIIRNTAKHAPKKKGHTTFTIKIEDAFDDFFKVSIFDDIEYGDSEDETSNKQNTGLQQRHKRLLQLIAQRNNNISQDILDPETNEIRAHGWGTIEMKIACCYLNGIPSISIDDIEYAPLGLHMSKGIENIDDFDFKRYDDFLSFQDENVEMRWPEHKNEHESLSGFYRVKHGNRYFPLLQAVHGNDNPTSGFGYAFLLKKPKEVLIIDPMGRLDTFLGETLENSHQDLRTSESKTKRQALQQIGIDVYREINVESIYTHSHLLVISDSLDDYKYKTNIPQEMCAVQQNQEGNLCTYHYFDFYKSDITKANKIKLETYLNFCIQHNDPIYINKVFNELYFKSVDMFVSPKGISNSNSLGTQNINRLNFLTTMKTMKIKEYVEGSYEHHGLEKKEFETDLKTKGFIELYGSSSKIGFYFLSLDRKIQKALNTNSRDIQHIRDHTYGFLARACNTLVAIVDERIQKVLNEVAFVAENDENDSGDFIYNYREIFQGIKIVIPEEKEINLNQTGLNTKRNELLQWIEETTKSCHYLIIHFGIIESLRTSNIGIDSVKKDIKDKCVENHCKLVITSGRGFTKDVASLNEYFLSYSSLSNLVLDKNNRSKAHLVSVLNALRKPNK